MCFSQEKRKHWTIATYLLLQFTPRDLCEVHVVPQPNSLASYIICAHLDWEITYESLL